VASLPYRFKGGMAPAVSQEHHHRSTTKSPHHQQVMSKIDRRHHARQVQQAKNKAYQRNAGIFSGQKGAPRIVTVVPLTADGDTVGAVRSLNQSLDQEGVVAAGKPNTVTVDRFKQTLQYVPVERDLLGVLDACRVADFVVLVLSAQEEVDPEGELLLRTM